MKIKDRLVSNSRYEYAMGYLQMLRSEVADLSFPADS